MASAEDRLPRVKHADRPRSDEKILKRGGADLNNGWLGRHGTLYLTETRMVFVPTLLDTVLGAKRREIPRASITAIERWPISPGGMPRGAKRPRMYIYADGVRYQFLFSDLDAWFDLLEVLLRKAQREDPSLPAIEFRRTGIENALLESIGGFDPE
ncbi:MAG: hypothetical protein EXQ74_04075 [Thermoleophilia bacterium]|nr:hypothetical protein [Thermoleophilia bacterium]